MTRTRTAFHNAAPVPRNHAKVFKVRQARAYVSICVTCAVC
nr:MAG TPA: hypothetical protein [Caudoviricetes sp.]